jgi:hypothetical protein
MNEMLMVVMAVLNLVLLGIIFLLLITLLYNTNRALTEFPVLRLRLENLYNTASKMENMLQHIISVSAWEDGNSSGRDSPPRAIRTPGGIIMATSLEDFLTKIHNDPQFKGISKDQLEELRKLFEEDTFNDGDDPNEPWQEKK